MINREITLQEELLTEDRENAENYSMESLSNITSAKLTWDEINEVDIIKIINEVFQPVRNQDKKRIKYVAGNINEL